jgi:hypothetical protein
LNRGEKVVATAMVLYGDESRIEVKRNVVFHQP